jgi:hypothetical protein
MRLWRSAMKQRARGGELARERAKGFTQAIPPTQLVVRSYSAYKQECGGLLGNPTNAVGGSFILSLPPLGFTFRPI